MRRLFLVLATCAFIICAAAVPSRAAEGRFLAKDDIILYGMGLKVEPAKQTVPRNIATIVSTYLQTPNLPEGNIPPLPPDATVKGTLRGPGLETPLNLSVQANTPFHIPAQVTPGTYTLDNIRLEAGGQVLLRGNLESVVIEIIENLLVTQVTARPLTAAEIREKGIVFDQSNFQAYNFTAAFAVEPGKEIKLDMPVLLPALAGAEDVTASTVKIDSLAQPQLKNVSTIIPDSLRLAQTKIPNLSVTGFNLKPVNYKGNTFVVPPIPGVVVIPGDIGFLNQYFSVMLLVGNVAPAGSNLVVKDLKAEIVLPPGKDNVIGSADDPLRMAMKEGGESPRIQAVVQPGPDGKLGTADDVVSLAPGESGNAEYLVEGRREGSHTVEMEISGTLYGLPVGPVPVRGRAVGVVLVRNPTFTLTFTHPDIVNAGEEYSLDVTVTNTSESPANLVSINLHQQHLGGADLVDPTQSSKEIETILPGDSATVSFDLRSKVSGKVFAATLDSDEQIAGRFQLKSSVGELGIPLSPDSLVLPKEARSLPKSLREAALGLLGKAYATATAPAAALPKDVIRFGKKIVWTRGIEVAQAGFRYSLHEPLPDTALHLLMDFMGSGYPRLSEAYPKAEELKFEQDDFTGFDDLRRRSVRGDIVAEAVAALAKDAFVAGGSAFQKSFAEKMSYRPAHLSVVLDGGGSTPPVTLSLVDPQGRVLGEIGAKGKITKAIPFSDYLVFKDAGAVRGQMAVVAGPTAGAFRIRLVKTADAQQGATFSLSVVAPDADGTLRQLTFSGITADDLPVIDLPAGSPQSFTVEIVSAGAIGNGTPKAATARETIVDPAPSVIGIVQQADADIVANDCGIWRFGRIVAALFSEEVTSASVQDKFARSLITNYSLDDNAVVGVALQPDKRIAFIALRDPVGPFVPRSITFNGIVDRKGQTIDGQAVPIEATVTDPGAVVSGTVLQPDGNPLEGSEVRLFKQIEVMTEEGCAATWFGVSDKFTNPGATYSWDYVLRGTNKIVAIDPPTEESREISFTPARNGQRLNVNIVMLGRGTLKGKVVGEDGATALANAKIRVTSLTDNSQYGYTTDATGTFVIPRIPVGNILVEAVHVPTNSRVVQSSYIGQSGSTIEMTLVLYTEAVRKVTVKYAAVEGHILRYDGATPGAWLPVYAFYQHNSQDGLRCPGDPPPQECAVAAATTDSTGKYAMPEVPAGDYRIYAFDQATYQEGTARMIVPADQTAQLNILLSGGFGTIKGIVKDSSGTPVADAEVGGGVSLTKTDANGLFTLTDVPVGQRTLVAVSQALGAKGQAVVDVSTPGVEYGATIVLEAQGGVFGTVVDAKNNPVADLDIYLLGWCGDERCGIASGKTNASGAYNFPNVPVTTREYTVSAFRSDLSDGNVAAVSVRFAGQKVRADVAFKGRGKITGGIWNDNGNTPLAGKVSVSALRVVAAQSGSKKIGLGFEHTAHLKIIDTTIQNNTFVFDNVFVGPFVITAAGAFSPDPVTFAGELATDGETKEVNMRLSATSVVTGLVYGPDGVTPVKNAVVNFKSDEFKTICTDNDPMAAISQSGGVITIDFDKLDSAQTCKAIPQGIQSLDARTDDTGRFTFPLVTAGKFTLTVEERDASDVPTGRTGKIAALVAAGDTAELAVRLFARAPLKVKVLTHNGTTPVANAKVTVEHSARIGAPKSYLTNAQGEALFSGLDAFDEGTFTVLAESNDGFAGRASGKIIADGVQVEVKVYLFDHTVTVSGVVYRPDGITPVKNAEVYIANGQGDLAFAVTNANGEYSQDYIPLGDFRVNVFEAATGRRGFAAATAYLSTPVVTVNVNEMPIGLVKGTLYQGGELQPLAKWRVQLTQTYPSGRSLSLQATTGFDGKFSFPGVAAGAFSITATGEGGSASASGYLTREAEIIDIPMVANLLKPQKGTIVGWVYGANGNPAANTEVCLGWDCSPKTTADSDGKFTFYDIGLGRFTVYASSQVNSERGVGYGEVPYAGGTGFVKVVMEGLGTISGTVVDGGTPAGGAAVVLDKYPDAGCGNPSCRTFADPTTGAFIFRNVPAGPFTVVANDPVNPQKTGSAGGTLLPGGSASVTVAYADTATLKLKVIFPKGIAAAGVIGALSRTNDNFVLYRETDSSGIALFTAVPKGNYELLLQDPAGLGLAKRSLQIAADQDLSAEPIILDEAPPEVKATSPMPGEIRVALDTKVTVTFSEPVQPGSVDQNTITLSSADGPVDGFVQLQPGDTVVTFTPLHQLKDERVHTIRVSGVNDRVDRPMTKDFIATFTTKDVTPPTVVSQYPGQGNVSGIPLDTVIRVLYSEPFDPTAFTGQAIAVAGPSGAIDGRVDNIFGNTGVVFTPKYPLAENTSYSVTILPATDLSGNSQSGPTSLAFTTTDRTPPVVAGVAVSNGGVVVENGVATLTPTFSGGSDVALVDWYINGQPAQAVRTAPFTFSFQALAAYGVPGSKITVTAVATDTSGNRGIGFDASVTVVPDVFPQVNITAPAAAVSAGNCSRVSVRVEATDDVGVARIAYQAVGGVGLSDCQPAPGIPPATGSADVNPPAPSSWKEFAFYVPKGATPGSQIVINATAVDSKGQATKAAPVAITVVDTIPPTVSFAGLSSGDVVKPGQQLTAVVAAADVGGVTAISFAANNSAFTDSRTISPAQQNAAGTFTWTVPKTFTSRDSVRLEARAIDSAGNAADAPAVVLPVADTVPPKVTIRTANDSNDMIPGQPLSIIVSAEDDTLIGSISIKGTGAFTFSDGATVEPLGSVQRTFVVNVPADIADGAVLTVSATATDASANTSAPVSLALTAKSLQAVRLPASQLVAAGDPVVLTATLTQPAPAAGLQVDLAGGTTIRLEPSILSFSAGESSRTFTLTGLSGGSVSVTAQINGTTVATMPVTVRGGIVAGTVVNAQQVPVVGAQVVVNGITTTTGDGGVFFVEGIPGPKVTVTAYDAVNKLQGYRAAQMNVANGYLRGLSVVASEAGSIKGVVKLASGTAAADGVKVEIFAASDQTTQVWEPQFTATDGTFTFPSVQLGVYTLIASDNSGNRGRSTVYLTTSGAEVTATVTFLGRGTINGLIRDARGARVSGLTVTLRNNHLFGSDTATTVSGTGGTFTFTGVTVGSFSLSATDSVSGYGASTSGSITSDGQVVNATLTLAAYGSVEGHVYRADGVTPAAGVTVKAGNITLVTTDTGFYRFEVLPLAYHTITADDSAARTRASVTVQLQTHQQNLVRDVSLSGSGSVAVTIVDNSQNVVAGASVSLTDGYGTVSQSTDATGVAVFAHVYAGNFTVNASKTTLHGSTSGSVVDGGQLPITVTILADPAATVSGIVYAPDGATPAGGVTVTLSTIACRNSWYYCRSVSLTTDGDGGFTFTGQKLETYDLSVRDANSVLRAKSRDITLSSDGQVEQRTLTMVGLGVVNGRVFMPNSSTGAPNMPVTVRSLNPDFGTTTTVRTNAAGYYQVERVAVGPVAVTAGDTAQMLLGEIGGTVAADGVIITLDVSLLSNAVTMPQTLRDGNLSSFDIQGNGAIRYGTSNLFYVTNNTNDLGGAALYVTSADTTTVFPNLTAGTKEMSDRQFVLKPAAAIDGLNVTRKVYVPQEGYFARYLEVLENTTASAKTVTVQVKTTFNNSYYQNCYWWSCYGYVNYYNFLIESTSSGDNQLATGQGGDRWAVITNTSNYSYGSPIEIKAAAVWGGDNSQAYPSVATLTPWSSYDFSGAALKTAWDLTIQPGERVAFMHFLVQEPSIAGATAAAQRLSQLPPEALAGLGQDDLLAIRNFSVPVDGSSSLTALPRLTGTVTVNVKDGTGAPVQSTVNVTLKSVSPIFGKTFTAQNETCVYDWWWGYTCTVSPQAIFTSNLYSSNPTMGILLGPFTVASSVTAGSLTVDATATGDFAAGASTATVDLQFVNSGNAAGVAKFNNGSVVTNGTVRMLNGTNEIQRMNPSGSGAFTFQLLPPGSFTLELCVPSSMGGSQSCTRKEITVTAGQTAAADITMPALGIVRGKVLSWDGNALVSHYLYLNGTGSTGSFSRSAYTDTSGGFAFTEIPPGTYELISNDPQTSLQRKIPIVMVAGQEIEQNLRFLKSGALTVQIQFADGTSYGSNVNLNVTEEPGGTSLYSSNWFYNGNSTSVFGSDAANLTISASISYNQGTNRTAVGQMTIPGFTTSGGLYLPATVKLPVNMSNVTLRALSTSGTPVTGEQLEVRLVDPTDGTTWSSCWTSSSTGSCMIYSVFAGEAGLKAQVLVAEAVVAEATAQMTASNGTTTIDLQLPFDPVQFPKYMYDGNGSYFDINKDGALHYGENYVFQQYSSNTTSAMVLQLTPLQGTAVRFDGPASNSGVSEDKGREVVAKQSGVAGLDVVRKIYVPSDGYFARYLDILTNPGAQDVTVDLSMSTSFDYNYSNNYAVRAASDPAIGDTEPADRSLSGSTWAVVADNQQVKPVAFVWTDDLSRGPTAASFLKSMGSYYTPAKFSDSFHVSVPAGKSVAVMHFLVQQSTKDAAVASAQRLVQLPPEAIAGMSADERQMVVNFAVPEDGVGTISPLPLMDGQVAGYVKDQAGNPLLGTSEDAVVYFTSTLPYYPKSMAVYANGSGRFTFAPINAQSSSRRMIPRAPFTLRATVPRWAFTASSPIIPGAFAVGESIALQDVVFSTTGSIVATVNLFEGGAVTGARVYATTVECSGCSSTPYFENRGDGTYREGFFPAGTYKVWVELPAPQVNSSGGTGTSATAQVTVVEGQENPVTVTFPLFGSIGGTVKDLAGNAVASTYVTIRSATKSSFSRWLYTYSGTNGGAAGTFVFQQLPPDSYVVEINDKSGNGVTYRYNITVAAGEAVSRDFSYVTYGRVTGKVSFKTPLSSYYPTYVNLQIIDPATGMQVTSTSTGSSDTFTFGRFAVPTTAGALYEARLSFSYYINSGSKVVTASKVVPNFTTNDQLIDIGTLSLPVDRGNVTVNLQNSSGAAFDKNVSVEIREPDGTVLTSAYFSGSYTFSGIYTAQTTLTARATYAGAIYEAPVTLVANGTAQATIQIPVFDGTVSGTLYAGDGTTPLAEAAYSIVRADGTKAACGSYYSYYYGWQYYYTCYTSGDGSFVTSAFPVRDGEQFKIVVSRADIEPLQSPFTFPAGVTSLTITPRLPVFVVRGTVQRADGSTLPAGSVTIVVTDPVTPGTYYTSGGYIQGDGSFVLFGTKTGAFTLTAQSVLGVSGSVNGEITDVLVPVTGVVVPLEPAGTVTGTVTRGGMPVANTEVVVSVPDRGLSQSYVTNSAGGFVAADVPFAAFTATARTSFGSGTIYSDTVAGSLTAENPAAQVALAFTLTPGSAYGTIRDAQGNAVSNRSVYITRVSDGSSYYAYTDGSGYYEVPGLSPGAYLSDSSGWYNNADFMGTATGTLAEGGTLSLDITLKAATYLGWAEFNRPDAWSVYAIARGGGIRSWWDIAGLYDSPYYYFHTLYDSVSGYDYYTRYATVDDAGQFETAPVVIGGKIYSRKVYTPPDSGFLRFVEVIKNPGTDAVTVAPYVDGYLEYPYYGSWTYVVDPAAGGNSYVVEKAPSDPYMPQVAMVMQGVNSSETPLPVTVVTSAASVTNARWSWPVTIPAGGSACIMHYVITAAPTDTNIEAKAKALRDLTEPYALTGLTSADRSCIKNFIVPQE